MPSDAEQITVPAPNAPRSRLRLRDLPRLFSPSERLFLYILTIVLALSAFVLIAQVNAAFSTEIPAHGGSLAEGTVGTPRFVNPILAVTPVDEDLTMLVYSGLLREESGAFIPDLAERYEVSEDGTTYTFHLRDNLTFHDGVALTSADVAFTVALAQNPDIKSPRRADWEGVSVQTPDDRTVIFTLPHPYAPFIENGTLGILPKHLWEGASADEFPFYALNTHPVGSGPYRVTDVTLDATGAPLEYKLKYFKKFALGAPHLASITYRAFRSEAELIDAAKADDIESFTILSPKTTPENLSAGAIRIPLERVFGVFFNQNRAPVLADASVRRALDAAIDKEAIVTNVLGGYGAPISRPIPAGVLVESDAASSTDTTVEDSAPDRTAQAREILAAGGWTFAAATSTDGAPAEETWRKGGSTLSIALATSDTEDLVATANAVADAWRAAGVRVDVQVYALAEFNQTVLRPRNYDAILFGEAVGASLDLFPFWHSSQRNDPGLNLALYANADADRALAAARTTVDITAREALIREFLGIVGKDSPATFLYAPEIGYVVPERVRGIDIAAVSAPAERFAGVYRWYRDTERVWNFFIK